MPRTRTWARRRAERLAAGLTQPDPERTRGRMGHLHRQIWKKFAAYEDRCVGVAGWPDAETRRRTIRARINKWAGECMGAERRGELGE